MAQYTYLTTANVNFGSGAAGANIGFGPGIARGGGGIPANARDRTAILVRADNTGTDAGNIEIISPTEVEANDGGFSQGASATPLDITTTATTSSWYVNNDTRTLQLINTFIIWNGNIQFDIRDWNVDIVDNISVNGGRGAGLQWFGQEGSNRARLWTRNTRLRLIRNVAGGSFNAGLASGARTEWNDDGGSQIFIVGAGNGNHGMFFSANNLTLDTSTGLVFGTPSAYNGPAATVNGELLTPNYNFSDVRPAVIRDDFQNDNANGLGLDGNFSVNVRSGNLGLDAETFTHGGGQLVAAATISEYRTNNRGTADSDQAYPAQAVMFRGSNNTVGNFSVTPNTEALVFDGHDYGTRTPQPVEGTNRGHWDAFKQREFTFVRPANATIAFGATTNPSSIRAWIRNSGDVANGGTGGLQASSRFVTDKLIANGQIDANGRLAYTPAGLADNFKTAKALPDVSAGNDFYFEGAATGTLRIPFQFINQADAANDDLRTVNKVETSIVKYPYIPIFLEETLAAFNYVDMRTDNLVIPDYISVQNQQTVNGYTSLASVQEAIDRRYSNYIESVIADTSPNSVGNSASLATDFELNNSAQNRLNYVGTVTLEDTVTDLITVNGTNELEIQAGANFNGSITATDFRSDKTSRTDVDGGTYTTNVTANMMDFSGTTFVGNVVGNGGTFIGSTFGGGSFNAMGADIRMSNTFNGNVLNLSGDVNTQTFGAVTVDTQGALGTWSNVTFAQTGNTTIDVDTDSNITGWDVNLNLSNVIFTNAGGGARVTLILRENQATGVNSLGLTLTTQPDGTQTFDDTANNILFTVPAGAVFTRTYQVPAALRNGTFAVRDIDAPEATAPLVAPTEIDAGNAATYSFGIASNRANANNTIRFFWRPNSTRTEGYNTTFFDFIPANEPSIDSDQTINLTANRIVSVLWEDVVSADDVSLPANLGTAEMTMVGDGDNAPLAGVDRAEIQFRGSVGILDDATFGAARTLYIGLTSINGDVDYIERLVDNELTTDYINTAGSELQVNGAFCYLDSGDNNAQTVTAVTNTNLNVTRAQFIPNSFTLVDPETGQPGTGTTPTVNVLPNPAGATPGQIQAANAAAIQAANVATRRNQQTLRDNQIDLQTAIQRGSFRSATFSAGPIEDTTDK